MCVVLLQVTKQNKKLKHQSQLLIQHMQMSTVEISIDDLAAMDRDDTMDNSESTEERDQLNALVKSECRIHWRERGGGGREGTEITSEIKVYVLFT